MTMRSIAPRGFLLSRTAMCSWPRTPLFHLIAVTNALIAVTSALIGPFTVPNGDVLVPSHAPTRPRAHESWHGLAWRRYLSDRVLQLDRRSGKVVAVFGGSKLLDGPQVSERAATSSRRWSFAECLRRAVAPLHAA